VIRRALPGAAVLAAGVIAGCSGGGEPQRPEPVAAETGAQIVQPGAPGEPSRTISAEQAQAAERVRHTPADVDFMQGMIHHHAQALVMTKLARERRRGDDIALFARRMDLSQRTELEQMEAWLAERGEPVPSAADHAHEHGPDGELMPGMVGLAQLERLARARAGAFDRLFLRFMTRHHNGALTMVAILRAHGGGLEPEIDAFARHVESDQHIEIGRMADLRAQLPPAASARGGAAGGAAGFAGTPPRLCILG